MIVYSKKLIFILETFEMMNGIFLLLGSNLGDRQKVLHTARKQIETLAGAVVNASSIYETKAWGITDQPAFLNQVLEIKSSFNPQELLDILLEIERDMGRIRYKKWHERLIDIDILYYGDLLMQSENLTIPHPENQNRNFVLVPMAEIAPNLTHPVLGLSQLELLKNCVDQLEVVPLGENA